MFAEAELDCRAALLDRVEAWARAGVDWIQVREKDLKDSDLESLSRSLVEAVRRVGGAARVVVNGPSEIAEAAGADGVHLAGGERALLGERAKAARAAMGECALVSVACHSAEEAELARAAGASVVLFAPVFEKVVEGGRSLPGVGLEALRAACRAASPAPVFALGGVSVGNAAACVAGGAAGVAGIRLFAGDAWRALS